MSITMHINSLPDLMLRRIFSKVPLADVLLNGRLVCPLWNLYCIEACQQVRSLTLLIGSSSAKSLITNSCFTLKYRDLLLNEDGTRMYSSQYSNKFYHLTLYDSFTLDDSVKLLNTFPYINTLEIAIKYVGGWFLLIPMVPLLAQWSSMLKSLKMYFKFNGPCLCSQTKWFTEEANEVSNLFEVINSMKSLEHLTLDSDINVLITKATDLDSSSPKPPDHLPNLSNQIDLPILGRLREFYFKSSDYLNTFEKLLNSYAVPNENLRQIGLQHSNIASIYQRFPYLATKIVYLPLFSSAINSIQIRDILQSFESITKLYLISEGIFLRNRRQLSIDALNSISALPHLTHLHVENYIQDFFASSHFSRDFSRDFFPQLSSVQVLTIVIEFKSTSALESNLWAHLFPNVQVIELYIRTVLSFLSKQQLTKCLSTFVHCPKLHHLYTIQENPLDFAEDASVIEWVVQQEPDRKIIINVEK